jgi:hypothetical protein
MRTPAGLSFGAGATPCNNPRMTLEPVTTTTGCFVIQFGSVLDFLFGLGLIAIPAVSIPVIARIARRSPSQALRRNGRRRAGVQLHRVGLLVAALGLAGIVVSIATGTADPSTCDAASGIVAVVSVVLALIGGLLIGGGWALATRSTWVVLATVAVLDAWIFYVNLIVGADDPEAVRGLLLLAFAIHGICTTIAARWSFVTKDLGPIERAKAGEAGRTLSAVWAFLAAYTALTLIRADDGIFATAAGSAVIGALSLGALAVTKGSGFTKYAEAINAKPATHVVAATSAAGSTSPVPVTQLGTTGVNPDPQPGQPTVDPPAGPAREEPPATGSP